MVVPTEYHGREQSFLKHRVLREYLVAWAHKLGSIARRRKTRLWFVDCFAGPWQSKDQELADTSISIGLRALEDAAASWQRMGFSIDVSAIFVEPDPDAYQRLRSFLSQRAGNVETFPFEGEFGDHVADIGKRIGGDPAFLFVDPTGWKGAAMRYIAPLMGPRRDVMVNVMFNHVNRFKDDPREFLREQLKEFFGLDAENVPPLLDEDSLMELYRARLKQRCQVSFAADLAVPHPTHDRTWFRLVVGGNHRAVLELFREVERKVVGDEAGEVRTEAARRKREQRSSQAELVLGGVAQDRRYQVLHDAGLSAIETVVLELVAQTPRRFEDLWPTLLERHHVTKSDVAATLYAMRREGRIDIRGMKPREQVPKDGHIVARILPR